MRIPDPKANTTTEAYLAYKAGYLEESELKPKLYKPDWHFDGWLAYWAGLVNTYPTKENGDPEMLTDEEALVAYLSGVTDTYPEEIKDPYDVRIVGYLRHLVSIRWPEPDYPVNNEEFYLSTMEPTHTSNPEPSSDIELDTAEGKIISVEAYGDTFQQTYSGQNLFDMSVDNRVSWSDTLTEDENGWITATGYNGFYNFWTKPNMNLVPGATYYYVLEVKEVYAANASDHIMICNGTSTASASKPQFVDDADLKYTDLQAGGIYVGSITASSDFSNANNMLRSWCRPYSASSKLVFRLTIMSSQPSASTFVYEPYVGGIPAPNPDYPQAVQVVTGDQTIKTTGKNLFNPNVNAVTEIHSSNASLSKSIIKDGIRITFGTALTQPTSYAALVFIIGTVSEYLGKTLTFTSTTIPSGENKTYTYIGTCNASGGNRSQKKATDSTTVNISWTVEDDGNQYVMLALYGTISHSANVGDYMDYMYPQLEIGSATNYQPYQSQSYTISLGSIELCKIGDYRDKIFNNDPNEDWYNPDLEDNAWYVHKKVGTYTFDGTESWTAAAVGDGYVFYTTVITDYATQNNVPISKYFSGASNVSSYNATPRNSIAFINISGQTTPRFYVRYTGNFSNVNELRAFLRDNETKVYYALATPTDTKITDATLVGQLEALAGADTYNEKTFIKATANEPNLPALLKVDAYKY